MIDKYGNKYYGEFDNDYKQGQGYEVDKDNNKYIGQWDHDEK